MASFLNVVSGLLFLLIALAAYFLPTIIAFKRKHSYKYVILGINIIGFVGIFPWIAAFVWAAWPADKSLIDPLAGNVTGMGKRNTGDTIGAIQYGKERGYEDEKHK